MRSVSGPGLGGYWGSSGIVCQGSPIGAQTAGALVGPFTVSTNQDSVSLLVEPAGVLTDASGTAIDASAVVDGQELFLDLRASTSAGSATVTASAAGSSATGLIVSVPTTPGETPTADDHAQSFVLATPPTTTTDSDAAVQWAALAVPAIGTTLTDAADDDQVLPFTGGTLIDTVAYSGLEVGTSYTLNGVLMDRATGLATSITGSTTFTPTTADGTVEVDFTVPAGFAGQVLVAFETLVVTGDDTVVAEHADLDDAAQTVTVGPVPAIGTTLTDAADDDQVLPFTGGTLIDTVAYSGLEPGTSYTLDGELYDRATGLTTGITGSTTFTATESSGTVEVVLTVPGGYAGRTLVAFETLSTDGVEGAVAVHHDLEDAAQTIVVEPAAVVPAQTPQRLTGTGSPLDPGPVVLAGVLVALGLALTLRRGRAAAQTGRRRGLAR